MIGLVRKHLRTGYVTPFGFLLLLLVSAVAGVVMRSPNFYGVAIFALGFGFAGNLLWYLAQTCGKTEAVMPIKSAKVELCKYIVILVVMVVGLAAGSVYTFTNYISGVIISGCNCTNCVCNSCVCSLAAFMMFTFTGFITLFFLSAVFILTIPHLLPNRSTATILAVDFLVLLAFFGLSMAVSIPGTESNPWSWLSVVISGTLFVASYFWNIRLYKRRLTKTGVI